MEILVSDFGESAAKYGCRDSKDVKDEGQSVTSESWEEMKAQLLQVYKGMCLSFEIEGIGISSPGVANSERQVIEGISAIPRIHGFNISRDLETLFQFPVTTENDANRAGMAEFYGGAARDYQDVVFAVVGTGTGEAMLTKGQINKGAYLYGGEFGLMFLEGDQTFSKLGIAVQMVRWCCECKGADKSTYTGKDVFELAETGDGTAKEEAESFYTYLAKSLFSIQFSFDPGVIVLGGGVSVKDGLIGEIRSRTKKSTDQFDLYDLGPQILLYEYRNDASLVGAAANCIATGQGES